AGTVTVRATVVNGATALTNFTDDFDITVHPAGATIHTITYHANGGAGVVLAGSVADGDDYTVSANTFTRANHTFTGWNTQADGGGTAHAAGTVISNVTADITLYAQWAAVQSTAPTPTPAPIAPSGTRSTPGPRPGTPAFALHDAMSAARRAVSEVSATVSNQTTAESVLGAVRSVMPQGVTVWWSYGRSFTLVPATAGQDGSITGLLIITAGPYSSAIPLNITIPALGVTTRTFILQLDSHIITDQHGNTVITMDVLPVIQDGRTLLPVRFVAQALGASVSWNDSTREVTLIQDGRSLTFAIGQTAPGMDVPAQINDDRTMVPLRFISEFFGASVTWHEAERTVEITR
ncbi:MAG: stalk domain-containing protein, partial [Defluviitaleaceae bacterium]|nr:stalk domain-containing protein [Defluviitaleaceae bacterium]